MRRYFDAIIHSAAALAFGAVTYVDWRIGNANGCGLFWTPDANILLESQAYGAFRKCLNSVDAAEQFITLHTLGFDLVFPPLLALAAALATYRIACRLPRFAKMPWIAKAVTVSILPILYLVADYAENWIVMNWLKSVDDAVPALIPAMTAAKFAALAVAVILAVALKLSALRHVRET